MRGVRSSRVKGDLGTKKCVDEEGKIGAVGKHGRHTLVQKR